MKKSFILTLALCAASSFTYADSDDELQTIYITSQRTAEPVIEKVVGVNVITQEDILLSGAATLSEVLRGKAGISITDYYGDGGEAIIDLRGFGSTAGSNVLILVDGRRLNNPDIDGPNLNSISINNIKRIEIIKGSAGSLYGDQAVGGVVNIITEEVDGFSADLTSYLGSYNRRGYSGNITEKDDNNYLKVFFEKIKSDNYRDNSKSDSQHFSSKLGNANNDRKVFFEFQVDDDDRELPGALLSDEADEDPQQSLEDFQNDFTRTKEVLYRLGFEQKISTSFLE